MSPIFILGLFRSLNGFQFIGHCSELQFGSMPTTEICTTFFVVVDNLRITHGLQIDPHSTYNEGTHVTP